MPPKRNRSKIYLALSLVVSFGGLAAVLITDTSPRLGLDLRGGLSVILSAEGEGSTRSDVLDKTVSVIRQRIDALGVAEPEVTRAGTNNIFIQLPGVENEERALELIGTTAQLTFREVLESFPRAGADPTPSPSKDGKKGKGNDKKSEDAAHEEAAATDRSNEITQDKDSSVNDEEVVYPGAENPEVLYRLAPAAVKGDQVERAEAVTDQTGVRWLVTIDMDEQGARAWQELTARQACERDQGGDGSVAIVLDGEVVTTPTMDPEVKCNEGIGGGSSQIDVGDEQEAKDLALVLRYGALPVTLERQEVQKISPTLGEDSLQAGIRAGLLGLALVFIYMVLYYRALGFVVWLGLSVFTATIYTVLSFLGATAGLSLSLAGVAGFIISVGVTADSYIVAFERLKDEIHAGKTLRAAVERGMSRAFRTILVADFVTGSAAVILFFLAVGPVRGFALTLGLATLIDVLVAFYFTRPMVALLSNSRFFSSGRFIGMKAALGVEG